MSVHVYNNTITKSAGLHKGAVWPALELFVKVAVLTGLSLVTLTAPVNGAPEFAPEAMSSLSPAALTEQFDAELGQFDESASANPGGAIYSPFSTIFDASTAQRSETYAQAIHARHGEIEEAPVLSATTLVACIAAGLLVYLFRVLLTN